MSKISDIYDQLETKVTAALPTHKELSNPYFPETTADLGYEKAYGIGFGAGSNDEERDEVKSESKSQDFLLSLTRRIFARKKDTDSRKSAEKGLMEDQRVITDLIAKDKFLGDCKLILKALYITHDGIESVRVDRQDIIIVRSLIRIQYQEKTT